MNLKNDKKKIKINMEKFTVIQNAESEFILPIDKNIKDILYFIDYNIYLQQIEKDYSIKSGILQLKKINKDSIWKEFTKDLKRCDLKIDNVSIKSPENMFKYFSNKYSTEIAYRTIMFSTPSSLGLPCEILHDIYFKKNLCIAELNNNKRYFKINITTSENSINFLFDKNLRIITENGKTKYIIYIKIEFDILNDKMVLINFTLKKPKT